MQQPIVIGYDSGDKFGDKNAKMQQPIIIGYDSGDESVDKDAMMQQPVVLCYDSGDKFGDKNAMMQQPIVIGYDSGYEFNDNDVFKPGKFDDVGVQCEHIYKKEDCGGKQQRLMISGVPPSSHERLEKQTEDDEKFGTIAWSSGSHFSAKLTNTCPVDQQLMFLKTVGVEFGRQFVLSNFNQSIIDEKALRNAMESLFVVNMFSSEVHQIKRNLMFSAPIYASTMKFHNGSRDIIDCSSGIEPNVDLYSNVCARRISGVCQNGHVVPDRCVYYIPHVGHQLTTDVRAVTETIISCLVNDAKTETYCGHNLISGKRCGREIQYDFKFDRENPFVLPLYIESQNAELTKNALPKQFIVMNTEFQLRSIVLRDTARSHFNSIIRIHNKWYWYEDAADSTLSCDQFYGKMVEININRFVIKSTFTMEAVFYVKIGNAEVSRNIPKNVSLKTPSNEFSHNKQRHNNYRSDTQAGSSGMKRVIRGVKPSTYEAKDTVSTSNRYAILATMIDRSSIRNEISGKDGIVSARTDTQLNYCHAPGGASKKKPQFKPKKKVAHFKSITNLQCSTKLLYQRCKRFDLKDIETLQNMVEDHKTVIRLSEPNDPHLKRKERDLIRLEERVEYCNTFKGSLLNQVKLEREKKLKDMAAANAYASIANIHPVGILTSGIINVANGDPRVVNSNIDIETNDVIVGSSDEAYSETVDELLTGVINADKVKRCKPPDYVTEADVPVNRDDNNIDDLDEETANDLAMYFHGDTSLLMTADFINDMAIKLLVNYVKVHHTVEKPTRYVLEQKLDDIKMKIKHLCRSRRVGGPRLYKAITRLHVRYVEAHYQLCVDPHVVTDDDINKSLITQYGRQKCHSKHCDTHEQSSSLQYYTREQFCLMQLGISVGDQNSNEQGSENNVNNALDDAQLRDHIRKDTGDEDVSSNSVVYRPCDENCVIPAMWGLRLHNSLSMLKVENMGLVQLIELGQKFVTCKVCDSIGKDKCPIETCDDTIRVLRPLQVHYSGIRTILRMIYQVQSIVQKLNAINGAFLDESYNMLQTAFCSDYFHVSRQSTALEDEALETRNKKHSEEAVNQSFAPYLTQFALDVGEQFYPKHTCKLCHRMRRHNQMFTRKITKKWLMSHNATSRAVVTVLQKENKGLVYGRFLLCHDCRNCILKDRVPCFTSLNHFYLVPLPIELSRLTMYELMLVTKVRSTLKIISLKNKSGKHFGGCLAVVGSTTHLPLALEDTLEHIATNLPSLEYMQFILNALPKDIQHAIKQYLINFDNVLLAVQWLVKNNPLYADVKETSYDDFLEQVKAAARPLLEPVGMVVNDDESHLTVEHLSRKEQSMLDKRYGMQPCDFTTSVNNSFREVFQSKRIVSKSIHSNDVNIDCLAYPSVFPLGKFGLHDSVRSNSEEMRTIRSNAFYSALLSQQDPRVRLHKDFIFDAMLRKEQAQIFFGIWRLRNTGKFLGTDKFFEKVVERDSLFDYDINQIQQCNRGSPSFWQVEKRKLKTMDLEYGPSTFFVTFSCAEYKWADLRKYLEEMNPGYKHLDERELVARDPVSVMIFYMHRFDSLMKAIAPGLYKKKNAKPEKGVLGVVEHYYYRLEFQARGAPHIHMKLWVKDAPMVGKDDPEDIIKFIDEYICCKYPNPEDDPKLYLLVKDYQIHKCNKFSCQVKAKSKSAQMSTYCKSGFSNGGRPVVTQSKLLPMKTVIQSRRKQPLKLTQIVRTVEERMVNDYNPACLLLWEANMDIQYIGEMSQTINNYITGYITKHEQGSANDFLDKIDRTKSPNSILMSIAYHMNKCRELGIYEAIVRLIGLPYAGSDRPLAVITLGRRRDRHCKLRSKDFLIENKDNPDKSPVCANLINQYYPNRPESLSHLSLYEARACWLVSKTLPDSFEDPEEPCGPCISVHGSAKPHITVDEIVVNGHVIDTEDGESVVISSGDDNGDTSESSDNENILVNLDEDFDHLFDTGMNKDQNSEDIFEPECHKFLYPFDGYADNVGYFIKLRRPILVRYNEGQTKTHQQIETYQFKMLQLYKPWYDENLLLLPFTNVHDAFNDALSKYPLMKRTDETRQKYEDLAEMSKKMREEAEVASDDDDDDDMPLPSYDVYSRITELQNMLTQCDPDAPVDELVGSLNIAQRRIFDNVMSAIDHFDTAHDNGPCDCSEPIPPIRMFVSGVAGTGKSHLIKALTSAIHKQFTKAKGDKPSVVVVAPTGLAAWNVDGVTIHRFFKLNVSHNGAEPMLSNLSGEDIATFTAAYSNIRLIIVDEISMVSNVILAKMQLRLACLFPPNKSTFDARQTKNETQQLNETRCNTFGRRNILMFGDLLQLPPIVKRDRIGFVFSRFKARDKQIQRLLGSIGCQDLWSQFTYDELTENMRQKDDAPFAELLSSIRLGCLTSEHITMLQERTLIAQGLLKSLDIAAVARVFYKEHVKNNKAVALYGTTKDVDMFNSAMLFLYGHKRVVIDAIDKAKNHGPITSIRKKSKNSRKIVDRELKTSETAGLQTKLTIAVGARVMLRRNLKPQIGLVNGAMGTVEKINYLRCGQKVDNILVNFDEVEGNQLIERYEADYERTTNSYNTRYQFPLILCYAMTIHKSQGLTLPVVYAELGRDIHSASMAYVALSRTRKLADLHLIGFDPNLIYVDSLCIVEIDRLRKSFNVANPLLKQLPYHLSHFNRKPPDLLKTLAAKKTHEYSIDSNIPSVYEHVDFRRDAKAAKRVPTTAAYGDIPRALTFSNNRAESCYANAMVQVLLQSRVFCNFMNEKSGNRSSVVNKLKTEFNKLVTLQNKRPRDAVSVDSLRTLVHTDFVPTIGNQPPQQHSSFEFLTKLLDHFSENDSKLWKINETASVLWPCHNNNLHGIPQDDSFHALQISDENEFLNSPKWSELIFQRPHVSFTVLPKTYCGVCHSETDIQKIKRKFQTGDGNFKPNGQERFLQYMLDNYGQQPTKRITRSIDPSHRILFVDLPLLLNNVLLCNRKIKQRPAFNNYRFPAFPGIVFTLIGLVCRTGSVNSGHYFAYVRKDGKWLRLDCINHPTVREENIPANLANVAIMMFERNDDE